MEGVVRGMRRRTALQALQALADELEPGLRDAFLAAVRDIVGRVELRRVIERLERGDIDGALTALNVDPAAFRAFEEAIRATYIGGGVAVTDTLPILRDPLGGRITWRFDARSPRAERWMQELSSTRITRITDDMVEAARTVMTQGLADGRNPRSVALDLVGRVNRVTGRREGGILGLTSRQAEYVATARQDLLSGDPERLKHYLTLGRRNKSYDRAVTAAIRSGKPLPAAKVAEMTGKLSDSYLLLRGETVARTEAIGALNASAKESAEQMIDAGGLARQNVRKVWRSTSDNRVRDSHRALNGESVGIDERFGNGLMYPCEPGAAASEVINCRCMATYRYDHLANLT